LCTIVESVGETAVDAKLADLAATEKHVAAEFAEPEIQLGVRRIVGRATI